MCPPPAREAYLRHYVAALVAFLTVFVSVAAVTYVSAEMWGGHPVVLGSLAATVAWPMARSFTNGVIGGTMGGWRGSRLFGSLVGFHPFFGPWPRRR